MPTLTRALVRAALCWLGLSMALTTLGAAAPHVRVLGGFAVLGPASVHALVVGFVSQMIFGVALWMFPRPRLARARLHDLAGWMLFAALNLGLLLRLASEPLVAFVGTSAWGRALVAAAALQWLAALTFVALAWPRTKGR